jgi:hypothetical protein
MYWNPLAVRDCDALKCVRASRCEHALCRASPYARQWNSRVNHQKDHGMALSAPVIKSITTDAGTVVGASTNVNELVLHGTAQANSTVNVFDGTTFLGRPSEQRRRVGLCACALSDGAQSFTATATDATGTVRHRQQRSRTSYRTLPASRVR